MARAFDLIPIKEAIGLRGAPSPWSDFAVALAIFAGGALAGGAAALLCAPRSGHQLRAELRGWVDEACRRTRSPGKERPGVQS